MIEGEGGSFKKWFPIIRGGGGSARKWFSMIRGEGGSAIKWFSMIRGKGGSAKKWFSMTKVGRGVQTHPKKHDIINEQPLISNTTSGKAYGEQKQCSDKPGETTKYNPRHGGHSAKVQVPRVNSFKLSFRVQSKWSISSHDWTNEPF